ncbi:MAG TPA: BON domain-containing protein [Candidatus Limnocylindria bacterium]|nr:BON domain-containing protein [Candidatus Limnocylindria bacterium]
MIDGRGERDARKDDLFTEEPQDDPTEAVEEGEPYDAPTDAGEPLAVAVRHELRQDPATSGLDISVSVEDGIVTLRGTAADADDVDRALAAAGRVPGVVDVIDDIRIEDALER